MDINKSRILCGNLFIAPTDVDHCLLTGESDFDHCLDRKEKGENSARSGCIEWRVKEDGFESKS